MITEKRILAWTIGIAMWVLPSYPICTSVNAQTFPSSTTLDLAWSPDGAKLAVAGTNGLKLVDAFNAQMILDFQVPSTPVFDVIWSPDGSKLASSGPDGLIQIWNSNNGQLLATLSGHEARVTSLRWSPDGTRLASTSANSDDIYSLRTWDMVSFIPLAEFDASYLAEVLWTPDGSQLVVANTILGAYTFDSSLSMSNQAGIAQYKIGPDEPIGAVAITSDGQKLALGSFDEPVIYLWDITTNQLLRTLQGHTDSVLELDWNSSNTAIASVSLDGTMRIWDATTGEVRDVLNAQSSLYAVDWNSDGVRLAYGGEPSGGQAESFNIVDLPHR